MDPAFDMVETYELGEGLPSDAGRECGEWAAEVGEVSLRGDERAGLAAELIADGRATEAVMGAWCFGLARRCSTGGGGVSETVEDETEVGAAARTVVMFRGRSARVRR